MCLKRKEGEGEIGDMCAHKRWGRDSGRRGEYGTYILLEEERSE